MKVVEFKKEEKQTANSVLEASMDKLSDVVIVGVDKTNSDYLYMISNISGKSGIVYLIEQLKLQLLTGGFDLEEDY